MNFQDLRKNKKGFSLVELIVVIAIMAVMTAVLAPALLQYVEKSKTQKDESAMAEVVNAVKIAMSDEAVFNEVYRYCDNNIYSCFADQKTYKEIEAIDDVEDHPTYIETKSGDGFTICHWKLSDDARLSDEEEWELTGNMRGVILTFKQDMNLVSDHAPSIYDRKDTYVSNRKFIIADGKINNGGYPKHKEYINKMKASDDARNTGLLYNALVGTVGPEIPISSKTYQNSDYTIFINLASDQGGGFNVYGQWNGKNLETRIEQEPV